MTFFEDFSDYHYIESEAHPGLVNIGWLSQGHDYPTGEVPMEFLQRLLQLAKSPVNLCRGFHVCEFCSRSRNDPGLVLYKVLGQNLLGNGEIHIKLGESTYCAPVLIAHYVHAHKYLPPEQFIRAIMEGAPTGNKK